MIRESTFRRIVRASAWYDLLVTAPFALAPTVALVWPAFDALQRRLGGAPLPPLDAHAMLFANFFGSVVTVWALARIVFDDPRLGRYDAVGRVLFSVAMVRALQHGGTPLLYAFLVVESTFGLLQLLPVRGGLTTASAGGSLGPATAPSGA